MRTYGVIYGIVSIVVNMCQVSPAFAFSKTNPANPLQNFFKVVVEYPQEHINPQQVKLFIGQQFDEDPDGYRVEQLKDLLDYLTFLHSRVYFVVHNNEMLKSFLKSTEFKKAGIEKSLHKILWEEKRIFSVPHLEGAYVNDAEKGISAIYKNLKKLEPVLIERAQKLQVLNDELRSLKIEVLAFKRTEMVLPGTIGKSRMKDVDRRLKQKDELITRQSTVIDDLKRQFDEVRLGLDMFRERLQGTNERIDGLVKEVAARSLDVYGKEREMADARQKTETLRSELDETKERMRLVQRIIQEKDEHIQSLEKEVMQVQASRANTGVAKNAEVAVLRTEMSAEIQRLNAYVEQSREKIALLEKRFQDVALANAHLESELLKSSLKIVFLEKKNDHKDGMIIDLEKSSKLRSYKLNEMKNIVKIYQMKLKDYRQMLDKKDLERQSFRQPVMRYDSDTYSSRRFQAGQGSFDAACLMGRLNDRICFNNNFRNYRKNLNDTDYPGESK